MPTCDVFGVSFLNLLLINANQQRFTSRRILASTSLSTSIELSLRSGSAQSSPTTSIRPITPAGWSRRDTPRTLAGQRHGAACSTADQSRLVSSRLLSASNKCKSTTVHVTQNPSFHLLVNFIELSLDLVHAILTHNKHSAYHQWVGLATTLLELLPGSGAEPLVPRPTSLVAVVERLTGAQNCAVEGER